MKRTIRQTLMVETEEISFLIDRSSNDYIMCPECGGESFMLRPEKLAEATQIPAREIYRLVESGSVHFLERDGVFVCLTSLLGREEK